MLISYRATARFIVLAAFAFVCFQILTYCSEDGDVNVFSIEDDKDLGQQVKTEIRNNPQEYPILDRAQNPEAYAYIDQMLVDILNSGEVTYRDEFNWEVDIIDDRETLNAFCAPGGYICVYTGLIDYLDNGSDLAGVMGHEIAHADKRHVTDRLTKVYGLQTLLGLVLGENQGLVTEVAATLLVLEFTRNNEEEADMFSVIYLCPTEFKSDGAATFFQQLIEDDATGNTPQFLSTHPNPENRVPNIRNAAESRGCNTNYPQEEQAAYNAFKNNLGL